VDAFLKEFTFPAIGAGIQTPLTSGGLKLSESSYKQFVPVLGISVLNQSTCKIRVYINESPENSMRLSANGSRSLTGIPAWDVTVQNLDPTETIPAGAVIVTIFNDLESISYYENYRKKRGLLGR